MVNEYGLMDCFRSHAISGSYSHISMNSESVFIVYLQNFSPTGILILIFC